MARKLFGKSSREGNNQKVKFADASGSTTRGDVAILVNNTLDAEVVKVDTYKEK